MNPEIFKAYDIRGVWPTDINPELGEKIGRAYATLFKPEGPVAVGRDIRLHSEELQTAVIKGLTEQGVDVVDIGLISTEVYYFAVGYYGYAGGIMVTASHNPPEWHGLKMVKKGVVPITGEGGIYQLRDLVADGKFEPAAKTGEVTSKDVVPDFLAYLGRFFDPQEIKPMKLVINANFGLEGKLFEAFVDKYQLPLKLVPLNNEPDGHFPKGRPDPYIPENRAEFVELVKSSQANLGVAWDADADRVFFCADGGVFTEPYYTNLLIIQRMLKAHPGDAVTYDPRMNRATRAVARACGGRAYPNKVGHSYIKETLREHGGVFSGEASGHLIYRDFWFAESGILPVINILQILSETGQPLSALVKKWMDEYPISGEINSTVSKERQSEVFAELRKKYHDAEFDELDGLTIEYPEWRANIRPSNTEPLFRLNVEGETPEIVKTKTDELLGLIRA